MIDGARAQRNVKSLGKKESNGLHRSVDLQRNSYKMNGKSLFTFEGCRSDQDQRPQTQSEDPGGDHPLKKRDCFNPLRLTASRSAPAS